MLTERERAMIDEWLGADPQPTFESLAHIEKTHRVEKLETYEGVEGCFALVPTARFVGRFTMALRKTPKRADLYASMALGDAEVEPKEREEALAALAKLRGVFLVTDNGRFVSAERDETVKVYRDTDDWLLQWGFVKTPTGMTRIPPINDLCVWLNRSTGKLVNAGFRVHRIGLGGRLFTAGETTLLKPLIRDYKRYEVSITDSGDTFCVKTTTDSTVGWGTVDKKTGKRSDGGHRHFHRR